jgi:hypothetical protein
MSNLIVEVNRFYSDLSKYVFSETLFVSSCNTKQNGVQTHFNSERRLESVTIGQESNTVVEYFNEAKRTVIVFDGRYIYTVVKERR